jgi:hypothetical protein
MQIKGVGKFIVQRLGNEIIQIIQSFRNTEKDKGEENS